MFILDANRYARDPDGVAAIVNDLIAETGAEMLVSRLWEERKLAYPIKGQRKGVYWLTYFRAEGEKIAPLTRQCEINDTILRQLFIKLDEKLVDAIVEHASGATVTPYSSEVEEESGEDSGAEKAETATVGADS